MLRALICHPEANDLLLFASVVAEFGFSPELSDSANVNEILARIGAPALVVSGFAPTDPRAVQLFASLRRFGGTTEIPTLVAHGDPIVVDAWQRASTTAKLVVLNSAAPVSALRQAIAALTGREPRMAPQAASEAMEPQRQPRPQAPAERASGSQPSWKAALEYVLRELDVPVCVLSLREGGRRRIIGAADFEMQPGEDALLESFVRLVEEANEPLIVPDAASHPLFERHPFIRAGLVRGYAGLPLRSSGEHKGAVCVFDSKPLRFGTPALERAALKVTELGDIEAASGSSRTEAEDPDVALLAQTLNSVAAAPSFPLTLAVIRPENGSASSRRVRDLAEDLRDVLRENDIVVAGRSGTVLLLLAVRESAAKAALARLSKRLQQSGVQVRVVSTEVSAGEQMAEAVARARRAFRSR